jgi:ABC-type transport system involved in cytochrome c biogenesis permease subunit
MVVLLASATVVEKLYGTEFATKTIYSSVYFVILWMLIAMFVLSYLFVRRKTLRWQQWLMHSSLVLILAGAFISWLSAETGTLHLRNKENVSCFTDNHNDVKTLPFTVALSDFKIDYYKGTETPMDFVSTLNILDNYSHSAITLNVSMNRIGEYKGYRFYQAGYDEDGLGTRLSISFDPYGIAVTYSGYCLLLLSIFLFFTDKQSRFRRMLTHPLLRKSSILLVFFTFAVSMKAADTPKSISPALAARLSNLYVLYNGRICPLQTMAKDFTVKLYGKTSYRSFSAEQVFAGWMFYSSEWEQQPMIKIKSAYVRKLLGITGKYASFKDFFNRENVYKLAVVKSAIARGVDISDKRGVDEADEKFNIIMSFYSGQTMKLFPFRLSGGEVQWYAPSDRLPVGMHGKQWIFVRKSLDYLFEMVITRDYKHAAMLLDKMREYQQKEAKAVLPSDKRFEAEKLYNSLGDFFLPAVMLIMIGLVLFFRSVGVMIGRSVVSRTEQIVTTVLLIAGMLFLSFAIVLRGYVSGHIPLSNGFETMQFMSWCSLLVAWVLQRRFAPAQSFGFLMSGLALMVAALGENNPQITPLMPVLNSPLLSIHVVIIMLAYSLLAFILFNGITAISLRWSKNDRSVEIERLAIISSILLYPAVFLLATGIFIGAVWANVSWGHYWSWDPKEVWALITLLIYSFALHADSLPCFRRPMFVHVFGILAFLSVLITYFGVNFLLGGMHSYAG